MNSEELKAAINKYILNNNYTEEELKKILLKEIHDAYKNKNHQLDEIKNCFENFIIKYNKKKLKAFSYLK